MAKTTTCQYTEARRGRLSPSATCPACGVRGAEHVRECEECGGDIAADDVENLVAPDGRLLCDDCGDAYLAVLERDAERRRIADAAYESE